MRMAYPPSPAANASIGPRCNAKYATPATIGGPASRAMVGMSRGGSFGLMNSRLRMIEATSNQLTIPTPNQALAKRYRWASEATIEPTKPPVAVGSR